MASTSSSRDGLMTDINVTPLVDVVLVLLVLMMVTATALAQKTIPVELPKAKTGDSSAANANKPLVVGVDEQGSLYLDTDKVDEAAVHLRAREAVARDAQVAAILAADGHARHEAVVHALEILRIERVQKIAIVVRGEKNAAASEGAGSP